MKAGDRVKFKEVIDDGDEDTLMIVREMRGDRVLVEDCGFDDWLVKPVSVYPMSDLVPA